MFLKFAVGAVITTITSLVITLGRHHTVQTTIGAIVRNVVVFDTGVLFCFWTAKTWLHFVSFWKFAFAVQINVFLQRSKIFETVTEIVKSQLIVFDETDHLYKLSK